jgi:S-adenosylmethionine:tRNA ribosyltransferase-isomerase
VKTSSFSFELPPDRIAQKPPDRRGASRLLLLRRAGGLVRHSLVRELPAHVAPGTVMVLNDTRVRKARLFGSAEPTGGSVEVLLLEEVGPGLWRTLTSRMKKQQPGRRIRFPEGVCATVRVHEPEAGANDACRYLEFRPPLDEAYLERYGHVPLPPYIRRPDTPADAERYQTVYARVSGSAAAPTAGLHLTEQLLEELRRRGVELAYLTLHVGHGTFLPIRRPELEQHQMHEESYSIGPETAQAVARARREGRPVLAVGTTVVRALESAFRDGELATGWQRTSLFIRPGFTFQVVSQLLTNFHTPRSSLLVLVSAFAGRERVLEAYQEALRAGYQFYSYGDAMLIQ